MAKSDRETILSRVREQTRALDPIEPPSLKQEWTRYDDPIVTFAETLAGIGGQTIRVRDHNDLRTIVQEHPAFAEGDQIASAVPDLGLGNVDLDAVENPHDLEQVDFAILPGEFGVAENAAVWVTNHPVRHRVIYFLCQHLAFVVPASEFVSNMHEAYERLAFSGPEFGVFISGPSKTADIEQSLVIGAHGARSLTVFVIDPEPESPPQSDSPNGQQPS